MDAANHFVRLCAALRGLPPPDAAIDEPDAAIAAARELDGRDAEISTIASEPAAWTRVRSLAGRIDAQLDAVARPANQSAYESAVRSLFGALDEAEARLDRARYLGGDDRIDADDWWLFVHLVRLEPIYYGLFKCNLKRLVDYPNLYGFTRDLYQRRGVAETIDIAAVVSTQYLLYSDLEPKKVVPLGRGPDLWLPHDRAIRFGGARPTRGTEEGGVGSNTPGTFVRGRSGHRSFVTRDGSSGFLGEPDRYHLYVANNCPWSHRTVLARKLLGLEDIVSMDVLYYRRDPDHGWQFQPDEPGCTDDRLFGAKYLRAIYDRVGSKEGSVPVLFDKKTDRIVSNESAEIVRMFDEAFRDHVDPDVCLYPAAHQEEIDRLNAWIYVTVNNGAYKAGFTSSTAQYEAAFHDLFNAFDELDRRLAQTKFLVGAAISEADVRLFPTIFRFDPVYYTRFRLNRKMVRDYKNLHRWFRDMLAIPAVVEASNLEHCKRGYFGRTGNGIVPLGPSVPFG